MFRLDLHQLTDPGTGGHQKTDDKIPEIVVLCFQVPLERLTVFVCDNGVMEGFAGKFLPHGAENWRGRGRVPAVLPPGKEENDLRRRSAD